MAGLQRAHQVEERPERKLTPHCGHAAEPGMELGANRNAMPSSSRRRRSTEIPTSTSTPKRLSTSELPDRPVAARLPCLTTRTPHAASTIAVAG